MAISLNDSVSEAAAKRFKVTGAAVGVVVLGLVVVLPQAARNT